MRFTAEEKRFGGRTAQCIKRQRRLGRCLAQGSRWNTCDQFQHFSRLSSPFRSLIQPSPLLSHLKSSTSKSGYATLFFTPQNPMFYCLITHFTLPSKKYFLPKIKKPTPKRSKTDPFQRPKKVNQLPKFPHQTHHLPKLKPYPETIEQPLRIIGQDHSDFRTTLRNFRTAPRDFRTRPRNFRRQPRDFKRRPPNFLRSRFGVRRSNIGNICNCG